LKVAEDKIDIREWAKNLVLLACYSRKRRAIWATEESSYREL
jgi:hypothetical protein